MRCDQGNHHGQISQKAVGQEDLAKPPQLIRKGQGQAEAVAGGGEDNGGKLTAGELDEGAAEEVAEANAKGGQGQTGDILVCPHGDGQEAVDKAHTQRAEHTGQQRDQNAKERIDLGGGGKGLLIQECPNDAADAAHIHDAGDAQIQIAGFFGEGFAGGAKEQRDSLGDGSGNESKKIKHRLSPPSFRCGGS